MQDPRYVFLTHPSLGYIVSVTVIFKFLEMEIRGSLVGSEDWKTQSYSKCSAWTVSIPSPGSLLERRGSRRPGPLSQNLAAAGGLGEPRAHASPRALSYAVPVPSSGRAPPGPTVRVSRGKKPEATLTTTFGVLKDRKVSPYTSSSGPVSTCGSHASRCPRVRLQGLNVDFPTL